MSEAFALSIDSIIVGERRREDYGDIEHKESTMGIALMETPVRIRVDQIEAGDRPEYMGGFTWVCTSVGAVTNDGAVELLGHSTEGDIAGQTTSRLFSATSIIRVARRD